MDATQKKPVNFSVSGFIRVTRFWNLLIIALAQYFTAGFLLKIEGAFYNRSLFILTGSTLIIAAAGYIINDYYDVKIDLINKPDRVVVGKMLKRRIAMISHTILNFIGIGLGFLLSYEVAAVNFLSAILLWAYSNQFKRMVLIGNFLVAILTGLSIYVVALHFDPTNALVLAYSLFAFFFTLIREIIKDIEDLKGDASFGCRTLPIVVGIRKTKIVIYVITIIMLTSLCFLLYSLIGNYMLWMCLSLLFPLAFLFYKMIYADTTSHFTFLSNYCKFVMLIGVLTMALFS